MPRLVPAVALLLVGLTAGCGGDDIDDLTDVVPTDASATALWISDVHFNPFYPKPPTAETAALVDALVDTTQTPHVWRDHTEWGAIFAGFADQDSVYAARGQDANTRTFQTVLTQAAATVPDPSAVLLTGDLLAHDFGDHYHSLAPTELQTDAGYDAFVDQTIAYVAASIREAIGGTAPVVAALGNNDSFCGDYDIRLDGDGSDFLGTTAGTALEYFLPGLSPAEQDSFRTSFAEGGRYAVGLPGGGRVLVVNSIPLLSAYPETWDLRDPYGRVCAGKTPVDGDAQLTWLQEQAAAPGPEWVAMHIPPGPACYDNTANWSAAHESTFASLFSGASAPLSTGFAAHSHMASYKLVGDGVVYQAPSIGPNHDNNPTFSVVTYDPATLNVEGIRVHYLDLDDGAWADYAFAGLDAAPTPAALASLRDSFPTDSTAWAAFQNSYGAYGPVGMGALTQDSTGCLVASM